MENIVFRYLFHGPHEEEGWGDGDDVAESVENGEGGEVQRIQGEHDGTEKGDAYADHETSGETLEW